MTELTETQKWLRGIAETPIKRFAEIHPVASDEIKRLIAELSSLQEANTRLERERDRAQGDLDFLEKSEAEISWSRSGFCTLRAGSTETKRTLRHAIRSARIEAGEICVECETGDPCEVHD